MERRMMIASAALGLLMIVLSLCCCCCYASSVSTSCPDSRTPAVVLGKSSHTFCDMVSGSSCCHAEEDAVLQQEFEAMTITDASCIAIVKHILCEKCIPSPSGQKLKINATRPTIPLRCSSPHSSSSARRLSSTVTSSPQQEGTCFEGIAAGTYNRMATHPDGSSRIFLSTQDGQIWLASVPARGSGSALQINDSPFLDLTDRVLQLVGIAFHPKFSTNGRFFVSYTCDSSTMPSCAGCSAGNCSQYQLLVSEFSAISGDDYSKTRADPAQVRRVFSMALPLQHPTSYNQHVGQILFWPIDNDDYYYVYLVAGHSGEGDLCKNNTSFCGKIVKLNVDNSTTPNIEIFAVGLSNPIGCSFDSARPSNFYCANVDQGHYEQVYLMTNMTGTYVGSASSNVASLVVIDHGRSAASGAPMIIGGIVYRGSADPSMSGRYLYIYGSAVQAAVVGTPETILPYASAPISSIWCSGTGSTPCTSGGGAISGQVHFLGEDNGKDLVILTTEGVFRLVERIICEVRLPQLSSQSSHKSMATLGGILGTVFMLLFAGVAIYYWKSSAAEGQAPQVSNVANIVGNNNRIAPVCICVCE